MEKLNALKEELLRYGKVAIAYSGGCDSNFLYQYARMVLGDDNVLAVMCLGEMMSFEDIDEAKELLQGGHYEIVPMDVFSVEAFKYNHKDRCYHCKKEVMGNVIKAGKKHGFKYFLDGKNKDDEGVYRPGIRACLELGILSPLADVNMTKKDVRRYSEYLGISTYKKPSNACLASRFPYETELTSEKLKRVSAGEALFHQRGILHMRLRVHDDLCRIELERNDFERVIHDKTLLEELEALGFSFITLDLKGITSGSYDKVTK